MTSNMNRPVAIIAAIIGIIGIIPIEFLSWWKADIVPLPNTMYSLYIDAFGQFMSENPFNSTVDVDKLPDMYLFSGILVIVGAVLLVLGGAKASKAAAAFGSIIMIAGPILFLIAHNGNDDLSTIAGWLGSDNVFFGSKDGVFLLGDIDWTLNIGFFLPIGGAVVGFLSLKSNK